jgi:hypothetical protein|tara:strand:- start:1840 stop:2376 length:537 start_codon:yes stop_codon:yes gene_type:complete
MNTHTLAIGTEKAQIDQEIVLGTIHLYSVTEVTLDISDIYSEIFPNYVSIDWGDKSELVEPDLTIYRDYKTQSIYPEIQKGAAPVFLTNTYKHIYYPSSYALKKEVTFKMNVGYVTGETTKISATVVTNSESYYQSVEDMDIVGLDLMDNENNTSRVSLLTQKGNYIVHLDNKSYKEK